MDKWSMESRCFRLMVVRFVPMRVSLTVTRQRLLTAGHLVLIAALAFTAEMLPDAGQWDDVALFWLLLGLASISGAFPLTVRQDLRISGSFFALVLAMA